MYVFLQKFFTCFTFKVEIWSTYSESESRSVVPDSAITMGSKVHGLLQARILEWVVFPFSRGSSQPRDQTQVSHIAGGFFTSWATGKPKNTGVGSLSLLQRIFLNQESNHGLLHCRRILYQRSYQGSPSQHTHGQINVCPWNACGGGQVHSSDLPHS